MKNMTLVTKLNSTHLKFKPCVTNIVDTKLLSTSATNIPKVRFIYLFQRTCQYNEVYK